MKELILIGAYCPDAERENLLNECVNSLQKCRNDYDILICSHTEIPSYILKKVDYVFYDKNNELITDLKYLNQPWFAPVNGTLILSTYIGESSTYLAVYRLLIAGLGFAKTFNYEKVHYVEYDTLMNDLSELYDNSKLLDEYDSVAYQKEERNYEQNIAWPIGNFVSIKVSSVNDLFINYDRDKLLDLLFESRSKTNEKITYDILRMNGNRIHVKNLDNLDSKDIHFALSRNTSRGGMDYWTVPYYNTKEDRIDLVVWNNKDDEPIDVSFIINDNELISFQQVKKFEWIIRALGNIEDVNSILILVNNKVKSHIILNEDNRELFKTTNYSEYK